MLWIHSSTVKRTLTRCYMLYYDTFKSAMPWIMRLLSAVVCSMDADHYTSGFILLQDIQLY